MTAAKHWLICHPDTPAKTIESISVELERSGTSAWLRYHVECQLAALALPEPSLPTRCDGLWQTTCFEAFMGQESYKEFNFAPSSQWAAYQFSGYREGMQELDLPRPPQIHLDISETHFALEATFAYPAHGQRLALSAVIEEADGTKSYWALAHPLGKPDFHHPTCFAATLPPPE